MVRLKKINQTRKELWVIFIYVVCSFLSDILIISHITSEYYIRLQVTIFTILEAFLFSLYLIQITRTPRLKSIMKSGLFVFCAFSVIYTYLLFGNNSQEYYSTIASLGAILSIISCIFVFFEQMSSPQSLFIYSTESFWIIVGILFYFAGTFFLSLVLPKLSIEEADRYWQLNLAANILKNVLFFVAFSMKIQLSGDSLFRKNHAL